MGWLGGLLLSLGLLGGASPASARPFEDPARGFRLELVRPWALAPGFGQLRQMRFEAPGGIGLVVELLKPGQAASAVIAARLRDAGARPQGAARGLRIGRQRAAGSLAAGPGGRMVGAFQYSDGGREFLLTLSCPRERWSVARRQAEALLADFGALAPAGSVQAPLRHPEAASVVGRWQGEAGQRLRLDKGGRLSLGGHRGRYRWVGDQLELQLAGGAPRRFAVERPGPGRLRLTPTQGTGRIEYRRLDAELPAGLVGRWRATVGAKPRLVLWLKASGQFQLAARRGRWSATDGQLALRVSAETQLHYRYRLRADRLRLSGGDLDDPLLLRRE